MSKSPAIFWRAAALFAALATSTQVALACDCFRALPGYENPPAAYPMEVCAGTAVLSLMFIWYLRLLYRTRNINLLPIFGGATVAAMSGGATWWALKLIDTNEFVRTNLWQLVSPIYSILTLTAQGGCAPFLVFMLIMITGSLGYLRRRAHERVISDLVRLTAFSLMAACLSNFALALAIHSLGELGNHLASFQGHLY